MAVTLRKFFRLNLGFANSVLYKPNFINVGVRFLFTDKDLGIPTYENTRFIFRNQFVSIEDNFRVKMKEICEKEGGVIFTEDLKVMLHLAQGSEEDFELVEKMLMKYNNSKSESQYTSYIFGPVVMRLLYYLNQPQKALSLFENPELVDMFMYNSALKVLMTLLFKHQMYDQVRSVFETVIKMKGQEYGLPLTILLYAACYKQNTPDATACALKHFKEHCKFIKPTVRATSFVAFSAIKNNLWQEALELLAVSPRPYSICIKSLKLLAFLRLERYMQIHAILKHATDQDLSVPHRHGFFAEVIYEVEDKLKQEDVPEGKEILSLIDTLRQQQRIESDKTLDDHLMKPLVRVVKTREGFTENRKFERNEPKRELKSFM